MTDPNHSIPVRASTMRQWVMRSLVAHSRTTSLGHVSTEAKRLWPNQPPRERLVILRHVRYPEAYHDEG